MLIFCIYKLTDITFVVSLKTIDLIYRGDGLTEMTSKGILLAKR
jgi:hypothetical protein